MSRLPALSQATISDRQEEADRRNFNLILACKGKLLSDYWVVRKGRLLLVPRMSLALEERKHIISVTRTEVRP